MEMKQLVYFITVVQAGTISGAAKKLHLSQPPLSMQMRLLEEELGVQLFERGARRITLTECGKLFYERALSITHLAEHAKEEVQDLSSQNGGLLRIGLISSASRYMVGEVLEGFRRGYPNVRMEFMEANTYRLLEMLLENTLEMAVVRTPFAMEGFEGSVLKKEPMVAVGRAEFFAGVRPREGKIRVQELSGKPLLIYRRWEDIIQHVFTKEGGSMQVYCKADDARTTVLCTQMGFGIGILPDSIVPMEAVMLGSEEEGKQALCRCTLADEELESSILLLHAKNRKLSHTAEMLWQYVQERKTVAEIGKKDILR